MTSQRRLWEDAFFLEATDPIGGAELCPRDGRPGCAMVDVLERQHRRQCNPASMEKGENKGVKRGTLENLNSEEKVTYNMNDTSLKWWADSSQPCAIAMMNAFNM